MVFLAWYNIVFYIPLAIGVLMVLGVALGISELPHGIDFDAEAEADASADADQDASSDGAADRGLTSLLGFGRAPVLVLLMSMTLIFGGAGTISNFFLASLLKTTGAFVLLSLAVALVLTFALTNAIATLVSKVLPTIETVSVTKADLIGCQGSLVLASDVSSGLAQITNNGDVYQVQCCSEEPIERGAAIMVTAFDPDRNVYVICRNPLA